MVKKQKQEVRVFVSYETLERELHLAVFNMLHQYPGLTPASKKGIVNIAVDDYINSVREISEEEEGEKPTP